MPGIVSVEVVESVDSTNEALKRQLATLADGQLLYAKSQTAGRGRYDRTWFSKPHRDLVFSFHLLDAASLPKTFQRSVCALIDTLAFEDVKDASVKLPNDIYVGRRKIAGLLIETRQSHRGRHIIVGVGVNVNTPRRGEKRFIATSMKEESSRSHHPSAVLSRFIECFNTIDDTTVSETFATYVRRLAQGAFIDGVYYELKNIDKKMVCELNSGTEKVFKPCSELDFELKTDKT